MRWKTVAAYVLVLFVISGLISVPFGMVLGHYVGNRWRVPAVVPISWGATVLAACLLVFVHLGKRQTSRIYAHALAVAGVSWIVAFPGNVLLVGQPAVYWALGILPLAATAVLGAFVGFLFRGRESL